MNNHRRHSSCLTGSIQKSIALQDPVGRVSRVGEGCCCPPLGTLCPEYMDARKRFAVRDIPRYFLKFRANILFKYTGKRGPSRGKSRVRVCVCVKVSLYLLEIGQVIVARGEADGGTLRIPLFAAARPPWRRGGGRRGPGR